MQNRMHHTLEVTVPENLLATSSNSRLKHPKTEMNIQLSELT